MANEAHKEPTMEEILASIRKIISDDDASVVDDAESDAVELSAADVLVADADNDDFDALLADDVVEDVEIDDAMFEDDQIDIVSSDTIPEPASFDEMVAQTDDFAEPDTIEPETFEVEESVAEVAPPPPVDTFTETDIPLTDAPKEADMAATAQYEKTILTEEATADAAAGSLGKLISKMDFGGDNTIEGLVREMLKPMIKDWLDTNLPGIVEEKVEAEVQRIARMAR